MSEFYHVSRNDLSGVADFNLQGFEHPKGPVSAEGLYTEEEFTATLTRLFPDGISRHAVQFILQPHRSVKGSDGLDYIPYLPQIETTFELIRQWKFPHIKSRFQAVFGCLSLSDAQRLIDETFSGVGTIYKVECESFFIADMSLLKTGMTFSANVLLAEKY